MVIDMSTSNIFKIRGIVLTTEEAEASLAAIRKKMNEQTVIVGELRTAGWEESRSSLSRMNDAITIGTDFRVYGVEIVNGNQLEFDVKFYVPISEDAIQLLYMVPVYLVQDTHRKDRQFVSIHARADV